jgi:V/A-type H+/Na+-transporting ATPase subunit G/H
MEDVLKRLLTAEKAAEGRVEQADAERKQTIQDALDRARSMQIEFDKQVEARRKPFLATAEDGARRRIAELEELASLQQRRLRDDAAGNEEAAVQAALGLILGES